MPPNVHDSGYKLLFSNRTIFRQQEQIDLLQAQLRVVYSQMQANASAEPAEPFSLRDEIPPHY